MSNLNIKPLSVVICDEVRTEDNGKNILIGVYGGDIIVPRLPITLGISAWIETKVISTGSGKIKIEVGIEGSDSKSGMEVEVAANEAGVVIPLVVPPLPVAMTTHNSTLYVKWSMDDGDWVVLKEKNVMTDRK